MTDALVLGVSVLALVGSTWSMLTCRRAYLDLKAANDRREGIVP